MDYSKHDGRQAIVTKYHGPTNANGTRYSARCQAGRVIPNHDDRLNEYQNHRRAAEMLARKLGWDREPLVGGSISSGSYVWVFVPQDDRQPIFEDFAYQVEMAGEGEMCSCESWADLADVWDQPGGLADTCPACRMAATQKGGE